MKNHMLPPSYRAECKRSNLATLPETWENVEHMEPKFVIGEQPNMQPEAGPENRRWELPKELEEEGVGLIKDLFNARAAVKFHGEGNVGPELEDVRLRINLFLSRVEEQASKELI